MKKKPHKFRKTNKSEKKFNNKLPTLHAASSAQNSPMKSSIFNKYELDIQLILIPLILLGIFSILILLNRYVLHIVSENTIESSDIASKIAPYPFVKNVAMPDLSAQTAIISDADSQVVLFSKNPDLRFSMASTTKIMTALTALDYYQDKSVLIVNSLGVEGTVLDLSQGDKFYFNDLMYAMLLPSANDAAETIARNYPGGKTIFIQKMNEKAAGLHLYNTHFSDPTGLDDDGDYTTVVDMARLAGFAIKNKKFSEVTSTKEKVITTINHAKLYPLQNLNKLLGTDGVTGIKTGTTEGAGEVLVTSTVKNDHTYIIVVMDSANRFADTKILLDFIAQNVRYIAPSP